MSRELSKVVVRVYQGGRTLRDGVESNPQHIYGVQEIPPPEEDFKFGDDGFPSKTDMVSGLFNSAVAIAASCGKKVDEATYRHRLSTCMDCEFMYKKTVRCRRCGCFLKIKAYFSAMKCPENLW